MRQQRIKIAISACLLGRRLRYDGGDKLDRRLRNAFDRLVTWVPVCPELDFGVPREPMRLLGPPDAPRAVCLSSGIDRTAALARYSRVKAQRLRRAGIRGCVLKARSPSCAVHDAKIHSGRAGAPRKGAGLFAREVRRRLPRVPIVDEEDLRDSRIRRMFLREAKMERRESSSSARRKG
jgi:uncharacterized protein YbbK (DUF523 family)